MIKKTDCHGIFKGVGVWLIFERALFKIKIKVKVATFKMSVGVLTIMVTLSKIKIGLYDRGRLFQDQGQFLGAHFLDEMAFLSI